MLWHVSVRRRRRRTRGEPENGLQAQEEPIAKARTRGLRLGAARERPGDRGGGGGRRPDGSGSKPGSAVRRDSDDQHAGARAAQHRPRREPVRIRRHRRRVPVEEQTRAARCATTRSSGRWAKASRSGTSPTRGSPTQAGGYLDSGLAERHPGPRERRRLDLRRRRGEPSSASTCLKTKYPTGKDQGVDIYRSSTTGRPASSTSHSRTASRNPPGGAHNSTLHPSGQYLAISNPCLRLGGRHRRPAEPLDERTCPPLPVHRRLEGHRRSLPAAGVAERRSA